MAEHDEKHRDEDTSADMLGGIARGPVVQSDSDRDLVRDRGDDDSRVSDPAEESRRAVDRDRYGIPDPNRGLNVRD